ncbi:MAG: cob(I)yrinic acid a,c-diamide adenosyltransferase [Prolixibacteraceae bacterium]|jgi:cob(I)alamin adenosyltransferase|nr:cob(I)yrinic acid a,c-diamide adenosyltransferase [Prolixibacteraceae bacterium]
MNSYIQVYTGNGKGKTTAAFGLAIRATGAGKKVYFAQFVKGKTYSEIKAVEQWLPSITVKQYGRGCFIVKEPEQSDIDAARTGLTEIKEILQSGQYQLVVLDEANIAIHYKLFSVNELLEAINARHPDTEIVVTGRYAPQELIDAADLVTEMKEIKHYYTQGVDARKGIEF